MTDKGEALSAKRLEIATRLLQGREWTVSKDGYDPQGFNAKHRAHMVYAAIDMAALLLNANAEYDSVGKEEK